MCPCIMNSVGINLRGSKHFWRCQIHGLGRWWLWIIAFPRYFDICNPQRVFLCCPPLTCFSWDVAKERHHEGINMLKIISNTIHAKTWWWWKINKLAYHQFHSTFQWYPKTNKGFNGGTQSHCTHLSSKTQFMFVYDTSFETSKCSQQAIKQRMNEECTMLAIYSMYCLLQGWPMIGCTMD